MYRFLLLTFFITTLPFFSSSVYAGNPPTLSEPLNNGETEDTSPKLTWEYDGVCPSSGSCYNVQVDDDINFGSLNKNTTTNNKFYSPVLSLGEWHFRARAKDVNGVWSSWSSVSSFIIVSPAPTPSPEPTPEPSPSLSPSPSLGPTPSPTPTPSATPNPSSFSTGGIPSSLDINNSFTVSVSLTLPSSPDSTFYLKGAFVKEGSTNYHGYTEVSGEWVKNSTGYSSQKRITTSSDGKWDGFIEVKADGEDTGYIGSGSYIFKVGRYSGAGSGPTWSNEVSVNIRGALKKEVEVDPSPSLTPKVSASPTSVKSSLVTSKSLKEATSEASLSAELYEASIAGVATTSPEVGVLSEIDYSKQANGGKINWWFIGAGFLVLLITWVLLVKKAITGYYFRRGYIN